MLEFHRNRNNVVIDQFKKFDTVKKLVESKIEELTTELKTNYSDYKHSDLELESFTEKIEKEVSEFYEGLEKTKNKSLNPSEEDKVLSKIESLISDKVGKPFTVEAIEEIYTDGEKRYQSKIPPGYKDVKKTEQYTHNGILIKSKFGDLIVWKQILEYSKKHENTDLIFVTRDLKEDWFWNARGQKIKCRPELTEEICNSSKVERFKIYNTARFIEFASSFLKSNLSVGVLTDVKSVSSLTDHLGNRKQLNYKIIEMAVINWLMKQGEHFLGKKSSYPDFETLKEGRLTGYEIKIIYGSKYSHSMVLQELERARSSLNSANAHLNEISIVYVFEDKNYLNRDIVQSVKYLTRTDGASIHLGLISDDQTFIPIIYSCGNP